MPKDNENIPFLGPVEPSEPLGFPAEQMICCEECLRANPPTRVSCLYCVAPLPLTEASARLRKPVLRQPEKHQLGYNNILLPASQVATEIVADAATLLKLSTENMQQLMSPGLPMPVARTASSEEAALVTLRLRDLGLNCLTLSDDELGLSNNIVKRVRAMSFDDEQVVISHSGSEQASFKWSDVILILPARLIERTMEIKERTSRKKENEILDTTEFFRDEVVIDFYTAAHSFTWRVGVSGFDFSCLGSEKALIANENIARLQRLIVAKAMNAQFDDSYQRVRNLLELVWSTQAETQSSGWRRERPGKLSVGVATTKSNETQFTRYSRLRHYLSCQS